MATLAATCSAATNPSQEIATPAPARSRYTRAGTRSVCHAMFRQIVAEYAARNAQAGIPTSSSTAETSSDVRRWMSLIAVGAGDPARQSSSPPALEGRTAIRLVCRPPTQPRLPAGLVDRRSPACRASHAPRSRRPGSAPWELPAGLPGRDHGYRRVSRRMERAGRVGSPHPPRWGDADDKQVGRTGEVPTRAGPPSGQLDARHARVPSIPHCSLRPATVMVTVGANDQVTGRPAAHAGRTSGVSSISPNSSAGSSNSRQSSPT
jgi:hypothetical protein